MGNSMSLGLSQKLTQTLKMTPEMQLAIKILQLNSVELKSQIQEVLESNPVVELDESKEMPTEIPLEKFEEKPADSISSVEFQEESRNDYGIDWQRYIEDTENTEIKYSSTNYSGDDEETSFENFVSKKTTLREHLTQQLSEVELSPTEQKIAEYLIGFVDNNGYIRTSDSEFAESLKIDVAIVTKVRKVIQNMDPLGVGAYDLRECLLIQAKDEGYENDAVIRIISDYLPDIAQNKLVNIAKGTGYDMDEIKDVIDTIKSFEPRPGASFPSSETQIFVTPEVFVEKVDDEYVVTVNETDMPQLRINPAYKDALKNLDKTEKATSDFIKNRLESARSFMKYIDKRKETILNVTKAIVEVQRDFFDFGILHLKPLTLMDVAMMAGVHESTVSRATNGKFAQTPRGLFELKFFFSGAARTNSGDDVSTMAVKQRIDDLVKSEDPSKPLSDQTIVEMLSKEGIELARRTVAKYRIELNIPSSSARRRK